MGMENMAFWIFLAAVTVASLTFVTIVVWAANRLRERQEFYRYEFRKRLVEAGKMDATSFAALKRYEHELGLQRGREKLLVAAFIFVGTGIGACVGFLFIGGAFWMMGFIPVSIGLSMLAYAFFVAPKPNPGPPPLGWSPEPDHKD